jgi:predicted PolB exonuclease-like 3'-5' exonuclease
MNMKLLSFDIETIPDIHHAKKILDIEADSESEAWEIIKQKRIEKTGHDFMPHYLQKIIAISLVFQDREQVKIWSIGEDNESEAEIIQRFFQGIEKYKPTLISWNGQGFDLPVLHYRALLHHIQAPSYWENGENFNDYKWNNYTSRYHARHTDLMDVLAGYQNKAFAPLDDLAHMVGLPGKIGLKGSEVYPAYLRGEINAICEYCESDVLNTYLIYLRFLWMKASISALQYHHLLENIESYISKQTHKLHWQLFLTYIKDLQKTLQI